jgi:hypothetical protein
MTVLRAILRARRAAGDIRRPSRIIRRAAWRAVYRRAYRRPGKGSKP